MAEHDLAPAITGISKEYVAEGKTSDDLIKYYEALLQKAERWCDDHDGMIGHLKLTLTTGEAAFMLSCTGSGVQQLGEKNFLNRDSLKYTVSFAAIVYGIEEDALNTFVESLFIK